MGVRIFSGEDGAVLYCSTTDWAFGPIMPGANVAEAFLKYLPQDARLYQDAELESKWSMFCQTRLSCPGGHYMKADVDTYGDKTIFTCMEKGCEYQWDINGEVVEDESPEEKAMSRAEALYDL